LSRGRKNRKSLPKAFEIFTTEDKSYVLKVGQISWFLKTFVYFQASDRTQADEWLKCLQVAIAQAQQQKNNV
jgi:hypothetical protein